MPNDLTRRLTHGAMIIALFTVIFAVSFYVPVLSLVTVLFVPLPIVWYSAKYNRTSSILVAVLCVFMTILVGGISVLSITLLLAPIGLVIGDSIRTKKSKLHLLIATSITLLLNLAIQYVIAVQLFNINFMDIILKVIREYYQQVELISKQFGNLPEGFEENIRSMHMLTEAVIPGAIILFVFLSSFIYIALYFPILKRLGLDVPKFAQFMEMKLPKSVLWYYLVVLLVTLFVELTPGSLTFTVFANASFILRILLFLQGIAFIHFFIHERGWPKVIMVIATILSFPLQTFTVLLGILDMSFNIRSFMQNSTKK